MNWHYVDQGKQTDPVTEEQFADLVRTGTIQPDTLVWREGMADWQPYRMVSGQSSPGAAAGSPAGDNPEAVCIECGKNFPINETIRYGNSRVCAACKPVFLQKLSEGAQINTGELRYASILTRFGAIFLDGLIIGGINMGIGFFAGLAMAATIRTQPTAAITLQAVLFAINITIAATYEGIMVGKYGATLGKMACKIKVVTPDGGPISYGRAFGRYFAKLLSYMICMIGYIMACFDTPEKRALHDRICNTRVVLK